jgi:hypothetical protein
MGSSFREPRHANELVALHSGWGASGFFPQTFGFFRKALVEGIDLFETTPFLQGALLSIRGRWERKGVLSTGIYLGPLGDARPTFGEPIGSNW